MTLAGAMLDDLEALQKGFVVMLPQDEKGRGVLFYDRIRAIPSVASRDSVVRYTWTHGSPNTHVSK
jgi:hypothetical protein